MRFKKPLIVIIIFVLGVGAVVHPGIASANQSDPVPSTQTSASDLILAMNTLRVANGLPPLIEDPIVNAVAQATAETMAASQMSWHIGDVRGRIASAGYGGGSTIFATENFAVGYGGLGIDEVMAMWADPDHMRPAVTPAYCHVGAGIAKTPDGKRTYYILQAAYVAGSACGSITYPEGTVQAGISSVSQVIIPVQLATPGADGKIFHEVQPGQSLWAIAIAYQITINDLETWNNISRNNPLQKGQKLFIPGKNTAGYSTPTPVGMINLSAPDADGRIVHEVQSYQTLITIGDAYGVTVDRILALNGLQKDWPLQIGQKLLIDPGHLTPSPTLSAIQKLTPASDGNYYHIVQSGQTLSWIAGYYDVSLLELMNWNGLNNTSVIRPDQKLLLRVTPPPTATFTPLPPTATPTLYPTATPAPPTPTPTQTATGAVSSGGLNIGWIFLIFAGVIIASGLVLWGISRKQQQ